MGFLERLLEAFTIPEVEKALDKIEITPEQERLYRDWLHGKREAVEVGRGGPILVGPRKKSPQERGKKVEKYKLTPEQLEFQRKIKALQDTQKLLELGTIKFQRDAQDLRDMWEMLNEEFENIKPPLKKVRELPEMDFGTEETPEEDLSGPPP